MQPEPDSQEHHKQRSEFIRKLVQRTSSDRIIAERYVYPTPKTIVQFWHDLRDLPSDIEECIASWTRWDTNGYTHRIFDENTAKAFIVRSLGSRYEQAFGRCYHPAMQCDYFRLCYLQVEGGGYFDADDVCVGVGIDWLFADSRLKLQPLCYDIATATMVNPSVFLAVEAYDPNWVFYVNNNPLVVGPGHPVIERALSRATSFLESADKGALPEIQETTGPGNLSKSIFELGSTLGSNFENDLVVLRDWDTFAVSRWPLSYRDDARNWRHSNQKRFDPTRISPG